MQHLKAMAEIVEANVRQFSIVDRKLTDLSTEAMGWEWISIFDLLDERVTVDE